MKRIIFITTFLVLPFIMFAQKTAKLEVDYSFKNIEKGYDHLTMTKIFVDDELVASSSEHLQSKPAKIKCKIPKGNHTIKIMNYAKYENKWEEHTVANTYSIDCKHEVTDNFNKGRYKIKLIFDIDKGTIVK